MGIWKQLRGAVFILGLCVVAWGQPHAWAQYEAPDQSSSKSLCATADAYVVDVRVLASNPDEFNLKRVSVVAQPVLGQAMCTQRACLEGDTCCNRCNARYELRIEGMSPATPAIVLTGSAALTFGCSGTDCDWQNKCAPFTTVDPKSALFYKFEGIFKVNTFGEQELVVDRFQPIVAVPG